MVLFGTGLLSLLLATPFILDEENHRLKKRPHLHSLEHMGIITFGIGIGGEIALFGALLHVFNHAVAKSLMFLAFGNVLREYRKLSFSRESKSLAFYTPSPATGSLLALGGLALVGMPPFNIFMSEWIILWGALFRLRDPVMPATPMFSPMDYRCRHYTLYALNHLNLVWTDQTPGQAPIAQNPQ